MERDDGTLERLRSTPACPQPPTSSARSGWSPPRPSADGLLLLVARFVFDVPLPTTASGLGDVRVGVPARHRLRHGLGIAYSTLAGRRSPPVRS